MKKKSSNKQKHQEGQYFFHDDDDGYWFYGHITLESLSVEDMHDFIYDVFGEKEKDISFIQQFYTQSNIEHEYGHYGRGKDEWGEFHTNLLFTIGHKCRGAFPVTIITLEQNQVPPNCSHFRIGQYREENDCQIYAEKKDFWRGSLSCRHCLHYNQKEKQKEIIRR